MRKKKLLNEKDPMIQRLIIDSGAYDGVYINAPILGDIICK